MKWIRLLPQLCTCRLNWARIISWEWWDEWDDTALQTHDSKFKSWMSEAKHATSRSRRLPTILRFMSGWGRDIFVSFKLAKPGNERRTLAWKSAVLNTTLGPRPRAYVKVYVMLNFKCNPWVVILSVLTHEHRYYLLHCLLSKRNIFNLWGFFHVGPASLYHSSPDRGQRVHGACGVKSIDASEQTIYLEDKKNFGYSTYVS